MSDSNANPLQDTLLREIDEDLRRERYAKLWRRYGNLVITAVVLLFAAVAGYQVWLRYQASRLEAASAEFVAAMETAGSDPAAAVGAFAALARSAPSGYAALARFQQAALLARSGDPTAALDVYQQIERSAPGAALRDLASLSYASLALAAPAAGVDRSEVAKRLTRLAANDSGFRFSARELQAAIALEEQRAADARELFTALAADPAAPLGVRGRAEMALTQLPAPQ